MKETFKQRLDKQFNQVPDNHVIVVNHAAGLNHGEVPPGTYVVLHEQAMRLLKLPTINGGYTEHYIGTLNSGEPRIWFGKGTGDLTVSRSLTDDYEPNWSEKMWRLCTGQIPLLSIVSRGSFHSVSVPDPLKVDSDTGFLVYDQDVVVITPAKPVEHITIPESTNQPTRQEMVRQFTEEVMALELWESAKNLDGQDLYNQSPNRFVIGEYPEHGRCDTQFVILPAMERTTGGFIRRVRFVVIADYEEGFPLQPSDLIPLPIDDLMVYKPEIKEGLFRLLTGVARSWQYIRLTYRLETPAGAFVPYP